MRCTTVVKKKWGRDLNRTGYWTLRLTDAHIFTSNDSSEPDSTNHNAMQDTGHYRSQKAGTTGRASSLRQPSLVLVSSGHLYKGAPSQHELKQESRVEVLCSEWPTASHEGILLIRRKSGFKLPVVCIPLGHASSLLASLTQSSSESKILTLEYDGFFCSVLWLKAER